MIILHKEQINQKIKRIAREIYERHVDDKELILIGIKDQGALFTRQIASELGQISPLKVTCGHIEIDKLNPSGSSIQMDITASALKNKHLVLVDDVLHSGKTLFYALSAIAQAHPKSIETVVLVERFHKRFPVEVSYCGIQLATTHKDHIYVVFNGTNDWSVELK